jgi:hypothetical protein
VYPDPDRSRKMLPRTRSGFYVVKFALEKKNIIVTGTVPKIKGTRVREKKNTQKSSLKSYY